MKDRESLPNMNGGLMVMIVGWIGVVLSFFQHDDLKHAIFGGASIVIVAIGLATSAIIDEIREGRGGA